MEDFGQRVVASWATAPSDAVITPPLVAMTARQFISPHWDGEVMRLRLSNRYAQLPVTLESLYVAEQAQEGSAATIPGSECPLTVQGRSRFTIPAGGSVVTDAIAFPVRAFQAMAISFFAPTAVLQLTRHFDAAEVPYFSIPGDLSLSSSASPFVSLPISLSNNFLLLEALEVAAPTKVSALVAVGDSLTDGSGNLAFTVAGLTGNNPAIGQDQRYPDFLARRVLDAGLSLSVVNKGISGNKLLSAGAVPQFGPALLNRFAHDVLATPGLSHILLMIGTNDLGVGVPASAQAIIDGHVQLIEAAQAQGLRVILGTIPPAKGAITGPLPLGLSDSVGVLHGTPQAIAARRQINDWILNQSLSDGVVDFYACLDDPDNPGYLRPEYNSGDNLHPNAAGYAAMADCVDLELLS
jgi:lysophospholipase L1-like esterase